MINDDEFVEDGTNVRDDVSVSSNDDKDKDKGSAKDSSSSPPSHDKWIWLHPAFHCLVTMVVSDSICLLTVFRKIFSKTFTFFLHT